MSFSQRLKTFILSNMGFADEAHSLPQRNTSGTQRVLTPTMLAQDWRLQVQDQCNELRVAINNKRSVGIIATEAEVLLRLLGEHNDDKR